ncbi:MAG TPA: ATP-binding protein [Candidatus Acidoferrales bacterium]|jgi:heavy metal sensor kinase|nr:ATP-binding protein [Candidatus Acidoferrales bacterium]
MKPLSIRLRLTVWYTAAMLTGLALFGCGIWLALQHRLLAAVDARLAQRVEGLRRALGAEGAIKSRARLRAELTEFAGEVPEGGLVQLRDPAGVLMLPNPSQLAFPNSSGAPFRTLTARVEVMSQPFEVLMAQSLDDTEAMMRDFRNLLLLMVPAVLLVACPGGYWLSSRALRPVDAITSVAGSIGVHNLSQRVAVPRTGDELQRMSETWNQVLERLETSVKRIRQFTADASHELRTPLALIRATAELALRREREPEDYRRSLRSIVDVSVQMTALTEDLLTMARADAHGLEMPLSAIDLAEQVRRVVEQSETMAAEKGIRLIAAANGAPVMAPANASGIRRLLVILIDNALRHTPAGGWVTVTAADSARGALLTVRDTGAGIAPSDMPHIFERFYRSDPARGGGGFGLGLSIAQVIARAHGSEIEVESRPGEGAQFQLRLGGDRPVTGNLHLPFLS